MGSWYVRIRGRIMGPFTLPQLQDMQSKGQLQQFHEISADKVTWQLAGHVDALFPSLAVTTRPAFHPPANNVAHPSPAAFAPPPRKSGSGMLFLIVGGVLGLIAVLGVVVVVLVVVLRYGNSPFGESREVIRFEEKMDPTERHRMLKESVGFVVCGLHVVRRDGSKVEIPQSTGTCFAVTPDGYLLTNRHVIIKIDEQKRSSDLRKLEEEAGAKITPTVWVFFTRTDKYVADIKYISENYDLAVLKVDRKNPHYFALSTRRVDEVAPDISVVACGFPGVQRDIVSTISGSEVKSSSGPVEGKFPEDTFSPNQEAGRVTTEPYEYKGSKLLSHPKVIQHTANIYPGNSGGPLLMTDGTVIGINTYRLVIRDEKKGADDWDAKRVNLSITLPQIQDEVRKNVPNVVWR